MLEPKFLYRKLTRNHLGQTWLCQTLIPTLWLVTPLCFLTKIAQILQKVIVFFLERREETKPWFWHIWIAQWLKFFGTTAYFFMSAILRRKREIKVQPKVLTLGPSLFRKNSNFSKNFQTMLFFVKVLPLVRSSTVLNHIWGSKDSTASQKGPFRG